MIESQRRTTGILDARQSMPVDSPCLSRISPHSLSQYDLLPAERSIRTTSHTRKVSESLSILKEYFFPLGPVHPHACPVSTHPSRANLHLSPHLWACSQHRLSISLIQSTAQRGIPLYPRPVLDLISSHCPPECRSLIALLALVSTARMGFL